MISLSTQVGHNFGSKHDPVSGAQCAPGGSTGNYIMYASSVTGERDNNNDFSACSKQMVGAVLQQRKGQCLIREGFWDFGAFSRFLIIRFF